MNPDSYSIRIDRPRAFQINVSDGGVPKLAIQSAQVSSTGVSGDRQNNTTSHGGPDRAVCIYSLEKIIGLQSAGHPLFPGSLGENLTIAGLDWSLVIPGSQVWVGDVLLEITKYTNPCSNLIPYFADGDYSRVSQVANPGWSRVYARVINPGILKVGNPIRLG